MISRLSSPFASRTSQFAPPSSIPPSHNAWIYALAAGRSGRASFMRAHPGLMLGLSLWSCSSTRARDNFPSEVIRSARPQDRRRSDLGLAHRHHHGGICPAAHATESRQSPAHRSCSRCSSIATINGANCHCWSDGRSHGRHCDVMIGFRRLANDGACISGEDTAFFVEVSRTNYVFLLLTPTDLVLGLLTSRLCCHRNRFSSW